MTVEPTNLVTLLKEAFPHPDSLQEDCWVWDAIEANQWDFGPEIEIVSTHGGRPDVLRRLREAHPVHRPHLEEHDDRILNVFTEVLAFAWAKEVAGLGVPRFVLAPGSPDLQVGEWWVEAKTVERSEVARAQAIADRPILKSDGIIMRGATDALPPAPGFLNKFQYHLEDSLKKWDRQQQSGRLAVFINLAHIDFPITRDGSRTLIVEWAIRVEKEHSIRVVICDGWRWRAPLYSGQT
jgi:hypothetical protein